MCDLLPVLNTLVTGLIGLGGVRLGGWLESHNAEKKARRETLIAVNKIVLVWKDLVLAKMLCDFGVSDEVYLRTASDKCLEAQALLEVVGSSEINFVFEDLRSAVSALSSKLLEFKMAGNFDPKLGIEQFAKVPETERYRRASRTWIDALRKESGVGPVVVPAEAAR